MSDAKQPEHMRPIPDGGLKDAMPSWLKRPPAWRDLPSAEQRHERSLPEPDTSEIDPRSLVDVSDLPQWLQSIAARGDIPVPTPDAAVEHAVEVVQSAQQSSAEVAEPRIALPSPVEDEPPALVERHTGTAASSNAASNQGPRSSLQHLPLWAGITIIVLMIALAFALISML